MHIDNANVYFDHPYNAPFDHALAIDFTCEADGGTERVAVPPGGRALSPPYSTLKAAFLTSCWAARPTRHPTS